MVIGGVLFLRMLTCLWIGRFEPLDEGLDILIQHIALEASIY